uniref:Uncharacterized protein n=2 Tax=Romanomermis culicivorax TaxID=13658 RepID=A0A915LEH5_ROMCU
MNGRCDCCDDVPDGDCSKCQDHSDEQCFCDEWQEKFYCDGNCISIKLWNDGKKDCPYSCIEPDVKSECLSKKTRCEPVEVH